MSSSADSVQKASSVVSGTEEKPRPKPCCACPETRRPRDECIAAKGEEHCGDLIQAHKECMRALGFKI
uniref:Cytochrome c oxidase copper chaperone n=1 Tax=Caligus clemensi TaxID=344056 RepID=C1C298_CALCM|nr:Cytochrome c oxidase copper chaperone [Caligus clemensi]